MGLGTRLAGIPEDRLLSVDSTRAWSIDSTDCFSSFLFKGTASTLPQNTLENPIADGTIMECTDDGRMYCYLDDSWIEIGSTEVTYSPNDVSLVYEACKIAREKCSTCGAPLPLSSAVNGICKCEYCRSENYIW